MLISFAVRNFRSIYERQEMSFLATKHEGLPGCIIKTSVAQNGALPLIAIYGANASGKTNFLKALYFFTSIIRKSFRSYKPNSGLPADPHFFHTDEPTTFDAVFSFRKKIYKFSFTYDQNRVIRESLHSGRNLVYRRIGNTYRFGEEMRAYKSITRTTRSNSLFISAAAQNNQPLLRNIYAWFDSWDTVTEERYPEEAMAARLLQDEKFRDFLSVALSIISPEIVGIQPGEATEEPVPPGVDETLASMLQDRQVWMRTQFVHESKDGSRRASLNLPEESRGTQSYVALVLSIFGVLLEGSVMLLDEADQSLHPSLLRSLLGLFQDVTTNPKRAQLVCTTHETTLLTPETLRPDQVWFAEKDEENYSRLYCLADFKGVRSDTRAERSYLEGRFGAVPFLEDHNRLFAEILSKDVRRKNAKTAKA